MVRLRQSLRVILSALLLAGALAGGSPSVSAAPPRPNPPTIPGHPRNGDPDMPDWNNRVGNPDKSSDVLASRTVWDLLRAMFARDEA
jgi:hypothetical protein